MNFQRGQTYKLNYTSIPFLLLVFPLLMNTISKTANIKDIITNITGIKIAATLLELRLFSFPQRTFCSQVWFIIYLVWFIITLVWFIKDLEKKKGKN